MDNSSVHAPKIIMFISNEVLYWTILVGAVGVCGTIGLFGIVTNVINIIVFIRQGVLSDSSTVSLFGLAISDLMCEVSLVWMAVCYSIVYFPPAGLPYYPLGMLMMTASHPHVTFTLITRYMTGLISFERCVCVLFPFKVKTLFTPYKTAAMTVSIYVVILMFVLLPKYVIYSFRWQRDPTTNRSILMPHDTGIVDAVGIRAFDYLAVHTLIPLSVVFVVVFTQATAIRVNVSRKWRKSTAVSGIQNADQNSNKGTKTEKSTKTDGTIGTKDKRLVKMIRVICIVFLICYTPEIIVSTVTVAANIISKNPNLFFFLHVFSFNLEALNSSINVFIYYNMSTRYRKEFRKLFGCGELKS